MVDKDFNADLDRAVALAERELAAILSRPGIVGVGAGPERKRGRLTGRAAIVVAVREKLSPASLEAAGVEPLPDVIDGIPVDVIEFQKPQEAAELRAAQAKAIRAKERVEKAWLAEPNVTGIGVAYKESGGKRTDVVSVTVYVEKKLPPAELKRRKLKAVPKTIGGIPTDVVVLPRMKPAIAASGSRGNTKDPLVGGISIGTANKLFWRGTLGSIVFDRPSGDQRVLSNEHVLDGAIGENVIQPGQIGLDDSIEVGFQLDICNPINFLRLDTPNTTLGTLLAAGSVAALIAAALSDEIDPTQRGRLATMPLAGAKTLAEQHSVRMSYPELPIPGTPFEIGTEWKYVRETTAGDLSHSVAEKRKNPHVLRYKGLFTDSRLYHSGDIVRLYGVVAPDDPKKQHRCDAYHCVALLTPKTVDRLFPVVLRETGSQQFGQALGDLARIVESTGEEGKKLLSMIRRNACIYTGSFVAGQDVPLGPWSHYLYVQTVNTVPDGTEPEKAAETIGGLPVSQNMTPNVDVACGPVVFEDGTFDIELI
jgi:hypothetical protein